MIIIIFWPFTRKLRFRRRGGSTFNKSFIDLRVQESWERIPVHQGVDLQLGIFVHVRAGVQQVPVDHLPNSRIQADLKWNKTRYVLVVCKRLLRETSSIKSDTHNLKYCPFKDQIVICDFPPSNDKLNNRKKEGEEEEKKIG